MPAFMAACAWGPDWSSRSRTQGEAFGGAKGEPEDAEMRSARRVIQVCGVVEAGIYYNRISMSTPAGSESRRCSESTVFGDGWRMSISRLWVRISKCSRESLSLKGDLITQ
jgi:hypothetical protein